MTHMIMKAFYDNEERGEEYSPTHFVLEINPPIVKHLRNLVKSVNSLKESPSEWVELIDCNFYFGFGLWAEWNESLVELAEEELVWVDNLDSCGELFEQQYISEGRISVNKEGDLRFFCFGKYDDEKIYTCSVNIFEIQKYLGNRLLESI